MKLRCQICFEWIAEVDKKTLAYPMNGTMFTSVDPHHGFPAPFPASATWEHMRCPYGSHRPFIKDDEIQTDEGLIAVKTVKREDFSTERTVKKREPIKKNTEDVHVRGVQQGIQDRKGKGRVPGKSKAEVFTCETCEKEFDKEINLSRHKRMAHKGV
jgi:hypothetical protein